MFAHGKLNHSPLACLSPIPTVAPRIASPAHTLCFLLKKCVEFDTALLKLDHAGKVLNSVLPQNLRISSSNNNHHLAYCVKLCIDGPIRFVKGIAWS